MSRQFFLRNLIVYIFNRIFQEIKSKFNKDYLHVDYLELIDLLFEIIYQLWCY